jgi:hypothetical protein
VTTTINTGHPLMNTNDERMRIRAALKHLGSGADLRDLPATASEKVALVKTASQRRLIAWNKGRGRYELTAAGWCELAPSRRFGVGSMLVGSAVGATIGVVALAAFWIAAGASRETTSRTAAAPPAISKKVASLSSPAVTGAVTSPAPLAVGPVAAQTASPAPAPTVPAVEPARNVAPAVAPAPIPEPTSIAADQPSPEQLAEAAAKAKHAAAKKARQRAAARRRREEAARAWAAAEPGTRPAEYSGYGGFGGQGSWFAYR